MMTTVVKGLAPPALLTGPRAIDQFRGEALLLLSDDAKALVIGPLMDRMTRLQAIGGNEHRIRELRNDIHLVIRGLYLYELRRHDVERSAHGVDIDPTTW